MNCKHKWRGYSGVNERGVATIPQCKKCNRLNLLGKLVGKIKIKRKNNFD